MANTFNYRFKEKYPSNTCVVKYHFGPEKFFIWKAKALHQSCEQVFKDLNRKIVKGVPDTDLFYNVVAYCRRARITICTVEVLYASDDLQSILDYDKAALEEGFKTGKCLNLSPEPYIPAWLKNPGDQKAPTLNKALQSIILEAPVEVYQRQAEIKASAIIAPIEAKPAISDTGKKDKIEKMRKLKANLK